MDSEKVKSSEKKRVNCHDNKRYWPASISHETMLFYLQVVLVMYSMLLLNTSIKLYWNNSWNILCLWFILNKKIIPNLELYFSSVIIVIEMYIDTSLKMLANMSFQFLSKLLFSKMLVFCG